MASNSGSQWSCQNNPQLREEQESPPPEEVEETAEQNQEEDVVVLNELANKVSSVDLGENAEGQENEEENHNALFVNPARPLVGAVTGVPNRNIPDRQEANEPRPFVHRPARVGPPSSFYNWQAMKPTVRERFQYLHNNETLADIHFVVGRGRQAQRIPAHKLILSAGSVVFDAMFNSVLASPSDDIELPDVEPSAFLSLLRFLYTDEVLIGPEIVMTTLYTAKKYAVPALEAHCVDFLKKNLGPHNAFMLLTQARLFDEPQLAALCLDCIDHNTSEAFNADGFTDIDFDTLLSVMKRDSLDIRECKLFAAVLRWASAECSRQNLDPTNENKRQVLGHAVTLIRFPLMTIEEFAQGPSQSGLLGDREIVDLFLYFTLNPKPRIPYSEKIRHGVKSKEQRTISRFYEVAQRWGYSGSSDRIKFKVDRKIMVAGLGLYGAIQGPADYQVKMQIICCDSGDVLAHNDTGFTCDGSSRPFRVMFKEPVEILEGVTHTISATLIGPDSYYGSRGHRKITHECLQSGKTTFSFSFAAGTNNGTSVDDGQIPEIIFTT